MNKKKKYIRKRSLRSIPAALALAAILCVLGLWGAGIAADRDRSVCISEVMTCGEPDWMEIENLSAAAVDLASWALMREAEPARAFVFPNVSLQPGERLIVYADDSMQTISGGALHAPFRLSSSGEKLILLGPNGVAIDEVEIPALKDNEVYCFSGGQWQTSAAATPGEANRVETYEGTVPDEIHTQPGALEISEIMSANASYHPDETGAYSDLVEIRNISDRPVSLAGWTLSDDRGELGKWAFPERTVQPGEYIVVWCDGQESDMHAGFRISSKGEEVYLTNPEGVTVSKVIVPALLDDQTYALTQDGWRTDFAPTPGYPNDQSGVDAAADEILARNPRGVYISEISAAMVGSYDWIELHNSSSQAVDLSGFGLSDNAARPRKWQFPSGTVIQPGEYLGVFASGLDENGHTNFQLAADGGYNIVLSDASGVIFDRIHVSAQFSDMTYGRMGGQGGLRHFDTATPGAQNGGATYLGRAPRAEYSVRGGFFRQGDSFAVELRAPAGCRIHYTTDLTDPDESDSMYTGPITVSDTTILRTRVYCDGYKASYMDTQSYLFDVKNGGGSVYVVSLVSDPYNLISDEAGILVRGNHSNNWQDWEREAHVEIFDQSGNMLLSQECGVKQQGQTTRDHPQQSLKLVARSKYGRSLFEGDLFTRNNFTQWKSLLLRTSNDDAKRSRMRDSVLSGLSIETGLMYQESEVCVVYLNGKYWGHYNLREAVSTQTICQFEGWVGDEDNIDLVVGNDDVMQGSNETFDQLLQWMKNNNPNTDEAWQKLDAAIDVQNYIEYMVTQICVGNTDPSNIKRYRNPNADGKWRWIVFDMDWAFLQDTNSIRRWLNPGGVGNGLRTDNSFFIACMKNKTFRDRFLTTLGQRMATTFSSENVLNAFKSRYVQLATILPDHFDRWDTSEAKFNNALAVVQSYAKSRPKRLLTFLKTSSKLDLSQAEMEHYFGDAMAAAGLTYDTVPRE